MKKHWRLGLALLALGLALGAAATGWAALAHRAADFRRLADAHEILERSGRSRGRSFTEAADRARSRLAAYRQGIEGVDENRRQRLRSILDKAGATSSFGRAADEGLRRTSGIDPAWRAEIERQEAETARLVKQYLELARRHEQSADFHARLKRRFQAAAARPWSAAGPDAESSRAGSGRTGQR